MKLAILFRKELTNYFNGKYLKDIVFYQLSNIDNRISNPDQRLTEDILKWSESLAQLCSNVSKPILDIYMFSKKLAETVGWEGPTILFVWYLICGAIMRVITPSFGTMAATNQNNEGDYRGHHFDILSHSEEIAFYNGADWENNERVKISFKKLMKHKNKTIYQKFFMGIFDSILVKYGAFVFGYVIVGLPIFGPRSAEYLKRINGDESIIVRDYVKNTGMLINLAKAIGKLIISYKEVQNLAGFTSLVTEIDVALNDMEKGKFVRTIVNDEFVN